MDIPNWEKNFAVIVQKSNPPILRDGGEHLDDTEEFHELADTAFGHAVMVLKIGNALHYRGYRPALEENQELRKALANSDVRLVITVLREGILAEICDELKMYQPRHKRLLVRTPTVNLVYKDLNHSEHDVNSIWTRVKQDEEKEEKHYTLKPDAVRKSGEFAADSLVHNCVTWIIETQRASVENLLLDPVPDGNISRFAEKLRETGDSDEPRKSD